MPIYEYRCSACGHELEVLQKFADPPAVICTKCGLAKLTKLVSVAGFQLKGSGWYQTDFKGSGSKPVPTGDDASKAEAKPSGTAGDVAKGDSAKGEAGRSEGNKSEGTKGEGTKGEGGNNDGAKTERKVTETSTKTVKSPAPSDASRSSPDA